MKIKKRKVRTGKGKEYYNYFLYIPITLVRNFNLENAEFELKVIDGIVVLTQKKEIK